MKDSASHMAKGYGRRNAAGLLLATAFLLTALAAATPASAQRALCRSLQAELAAVETGRGAGSSARYKEYDRAVRQQELQIRKTERAARRNGCNRRRSNVCQRINSSLAAMIANLESLRRQRDRLAPRKATSRDRERIIRSMRNNGCLDNDRSTVTVRRQQQQQPARSGRRTLLEQIFGTKTYSDTGAHGEVDPNMHRRFGTFRTLCVRTCDGYYFPISFSTTSDRFITDEDQCQKMCPGTQTELFFHPMPNGDAEQSISFRSGEPYQNLPNAFAYRKNVDTSCTCRYPKREFEEVAGTEPDPAEQNDRSIPVPQFRIDRDLDLDGLALAGGRLSAKRLIALANRRESEPAANGSSRIRIVGPEFFPVQ
ncbi:DUF2865 domain-containing protein [Salaquimonas pukyongi]|uniref:DUF2865 domain-containing protein n=1 Tax=Salaquimonas pukyongi TaxID=2712698 RepID=UPI00096B9CF2|nr:DUF2865 domain-containing protein [Salaquimonas pukyongi]